MKQNQIDAIVRSEGEEVMKEMLSDGVSLSTEADCMVALLKVYQEIITELPELDKHLDQFIAFTFEQDDCDDPGHSLAMLEGEAEYLMQSALRLAALAEIINDYFDDDDDDVDDDTEDDEALCPICDSPTETLFYNSNGDYVGCSCCLTSKSAKEVMG